MVKVVEFAKVLMIMESPKNVHQKLKLVGMDMEVSFFISMRNVNVY